MKSYKELFLKNLNSLRKDIDSYSNEKDLWSLKGDTKNTPANLCLHICGNLKHNFGKILGGGDYIRNRDAEFSKKDLPKAELLKEIDETIEIVSPVLNNLKEEDINRIFPDSSHGEGETIGGALTRLSWHFGYHAGQINYQRRLLTDKNN